VKRKNKNILIIFVLVVIAAAIGAGLFFMTLNQNSEQKQVPASQAESDKADDKNLDKENADTKANSSQYTDGKTPVQYEGQQPDDPPAYDNEQFRIPEGE